MERRILHFRVISFAVAVARVLDPSLRGRPVLLASGTGPRAVVLAVSEEARGEGVTRGLVLPEALGRCRGAAILRPDPDLYARAAGAVVSVLERFTPVVEPGRGGRFFADLTGTHRLFGAAVDVGARVQREIRERLRLPANAGVAVNKLVSGVAARVIRPVGLCDVLPGQEASFLRPVAVGNLPVVDPEVEGRLLSDLNVTYVGQIAALPPPMLAAAFGRKGPMLHRQARGLDDSPVRPPSRAPVVEERMPALPEDTNDDAVLLAALYSLIERGCRRLRRMGWFAGEASLSVRYSDGVTASRRAPLRPPLNRDMTLFIKIRPVFDEVVSRRGRVRSLTLRLARLGPAPAQMRLFPEMPERLHLDAGRERALLGALDRLRAKHGESAVLTGRASLVRGTGP
jgi:DNA polymerase-4